MHGASWVLEPRFPHVAPGAGHYESTYLTASEPDQGVAVWIRYTVHKRPGVAPTAAIWFTLFTPDGPTAVKVTAARPRTGDGLLLAVADLGAVRPDGATGSISAHGVAAAWDLSFTAQAEPLLHLPSAWLYRAPLPRTKSTSPYPSMRVTGSVTVAGRTLTVDGWPGMLGHNWGSEHAHRWIWLRGASFVQHPDAWMDVVIGRIAVGSRVLPWIANGVLAEGPDHRYRIGGFGRRVSVTERSDGCDLVLPGRDVSLAVRVTAPPGSSVGWEYADPGGGRHLVRNCSVAGVDVEVRRRDSGNAGRWLLTEHGGVYELGTVEGDPAVAVQPYRDG